MIYTVTCNPSLDYIVTVKDFEVGGVNRTEDERILPGGKGINVSIVLKNLGVSSTVLGFVAGFTGEEIRKRVKEKGCCEDLITINQGWSRINMKLRSNEESEINGQGPQIDGDAVDNLYARLDMLTEKDILVLAGSIPTSMPDTLYRDIAEKMTKMKVPVVVDATKNLLVNVLAYRPFLIKPNNHELSEIFQEELCHPEDIIRCAKKLQEQGARNVLVSRAKDGAILAAETGEVFTSPAPKGKVVNSVGSGDSMVAGFLTGYLLKQDYKEAFYMGIATGSASAFSEELATKEEAESLLKVMKETFE